MIQDIRILELSKQHYFDMYNTNPKFDYSCWGYYDGIKIYKSPENKNRSFKKQSNAPISSLWFGIGESIEDLNGRHSKQNIGIFRCFSAEKADFLEEFWNGKYSKIPYFAAGFVHIKQINEYRKIAEKIEGLSEEKFDNNDNLAKYRRVISYFTFDNVEIVVLVRSNSLLELGKVLKEIEEFEEVSYIHSIIGVSEEYLKDCGEDNVLEEWHGISCNIKDEIPSVLMKIVTAGNKNTIGKIRYLLDKQLKNSPDFTISNMAGHGNLLLQFTKIKVESILQMLLNGKFSTHLNPMYGEEIYNIETELCLKTQERLSTTPVEVEDKTDKNHEKLWCEFLIEEYVDKMQKALNDGDEGLYSYYRALIQTLNTLTQYEGFELSENIFQLLWPAFNMFDRQLSDALENSCDILQVKRAICEFLTAVNGIIYHTVHTDQVFLMVPGYSGTSYSIPIKLCLMYLGFADKVVELLNEDGCKYTFLLAPEMEARPLSTMIDTGSGLKDRLIRFCLSQRSLYMPRHFMLILTHEVAHYVGTTIRNRDLRCNNMIKTLAFIIVEGLMPEGKVSGIDDKIYDMLCSEIKDSLKTDCINYLTAQVAASKSPSRYFGEELKQLLYSGCQSYLADVKNGVGKYLFQIPHHFTERINEEHYFQVGEEVYKIQAWVENNRNAILSSNVMKECIEKILKLYREIFSDVAAMEILQCNKETYEEAFAVSEGVQIDVDQLDDIDGARLQIINAIFEGEETKQESVEEQECAATIQCVSDITPEEWPENYIDNICEYEWLGTYLTEYAEKCRDSISERLKENSFNSLENEIRTMFRQFCNKDLTCEKIYNNIMECIICHTDQVKMQYKSTLQEYNRK